MIQALTFTPTSPPIEAACKIGFRVLSVRTGQPGKAWQEFTDGSAPSGRTYITRRGLADIGQFRYVRPSQ